MPLPIGKQLLIADLTSLYSQETTLRAVPQWAKDHAEAIYKYAKTGIPTVTITTDGGGVAGYVTAGLVTGKGLGGFDKPVPGMGLTAAKPLLKAELIKIWSHGNAVKPVPVVAKETADAIDKYYSQAIIQTLEASSSPLPVPSPSGPVTGASYGIGGDLTIAPGTGFDAAKPILISELIRIWSQIDYKSPRSVEQFASELSIAIHEFCIQGIVNTVGTTTSPAAVDPLSGSGAWFQGIGLGTGTIT